MLCVGGSLLAARSNSSRKPGGISLSGLPSPLLGGPKNSIEKFPKYQQVATMKQRNKPANHNTTSSQWHCCCCCCCRRRRWRIILLWAHKRSHTYFTQCDTLRSQLVGRAGLCVWLVYVARAVHSISSSSSSSYPGAWPSPIGRMFQLIPPE